MNALLTITQRYETEDESDEEVIEDAFSRLFDPIPPQCMKLFDYDGSWRDVDESEVDFVRYLELVRGDDGYVLYPRF